MNSRYCLLLLSLLLFSSCYETVSTNPKKEDVESTFDDLLQEAIDDSYGNICGVSMSVNSPSLTKIWTGAKGYDSIEKDQKLSVDQPFRTASITKSFVATAILRLHEMDSLNIEEPISKYISDEHLKIIKNGGYQADKIMIKHCLNHTSGLYDYAMGKDSPYISTTTASPQKRWTRTAQLDGAMRWGTKVGEPGEKYDYGDTGYILLGEIVASFFEGDLARGLRDLLKFDKLKLNHTWLESLEEEPSNMSTPVHRYFQRLDVTTWDPSNDLYGGGGLVSTTQDLSTFIHALFNGEVFDKKSTLDLMLTKPVYASSYKPEENRRHKDYRYGFWGVTIYGEQAYLHNGLWGTSMLHVPAYNSSFAINFTKGRNERLMKKSILIIKNLKEGN